LEAARSTISIYYVLNLNICDVVQKIELIINSLKLSNVVPEAQFHSKGHNKSVTQEDKNHCA